MGHLKYRPLRPKQRRNFSRQKNSNQYKRRRKHCRQQQRVGKRLICCVRILLALPNRIFCTAAHADHQTAAVDKAVNRDRQIQRGKAVRTHPLRHKKCVGQNVARQPNHPHHIKGRIFCKCPEISRLTHKKTTSYIIPRPDKRKALNSYLQRPTIRDQCFCPSGDGY